MFRHYSRSRLEMRASCNYPFNLLVPGIALLAAAACQQTPVVQSAAAPASSAASIQFCSDVADLCVSPTGTGSNCSSAQPCSISSMQARVRQLNQAMNKDLVVELLGGSYQLSSPLQFAPADSGFNGYTVRYVAAPGSAPVLSGGISILNWTLHDPVKGIYQAAVPAGFDTRQLYVNGIRAQRARLVLQPEAPGNAVLGGGAIGNSQGYQITIPGMMTWANVQNIEAGESDWWVEMRCPVASISQGQIVMQNPCWTLANTPSIVYSFVRTMANGLNWLENAYAFLSQAGQWYLDRSVNVIYYIPRPGEDLGSAKIVAGALEQLITGSGALDSAGNPVFVENISFEGLTFVYATWLLPNTSIGFSEIYSGVCRDLTSVYGHRTPGAVTFSRARNISFNGDTFSHLGGSGLNFDTGSQNASVQGNVFADISGGAITVGDPDDSLQTDVNMQNTGHVINNNYITQTGVEYQGSSAILGFYTANALIENNEISYTPYTGLSMGWGWGVISYAGNNRINDNYIHNVMLNMWDGGGIYTNGSGSGSTLEGNYIDSVGTTGTCSTAGDAFDGYAGYSAMYHDSGSTYYDDSQDVIRNVSCLGYWVLVQTGDTDLTVADNYVDIDRVFRCPGDVAGPSSCLNVNGNSATGSSVFGASASLAAQAIMNNSGLALDYLVIRDLQIPF